MGIELREIDKGVTGKVWRANVGEELPITPSLYHASSKMHAKQIGKLSEKQVVL